MLEQLFIFPELLEEAEKTTDEVPASSTHRTRKEKLNDYDGFVEKFKPKKTTDDCYTPPAVMEVVENYVRGLPGVGDRPFVRPFYPGGDFENFEYPENCIVVDNPPFSIYSKIVRFYEEKKIDFFLFAPSMTATIAKVNACFVIAAANVFYENGANVRTSFVTSLLPVVRFRLDGDFASAVEAAGAKQTKQVKKYIHPANVLSAALLTKYSKLTFDIHTDEVCELAKVSYTKDFFGIPYLCSDEVAQRLEAQRLEAQRLEAQRLEAQRLEAQRLEAQRLEAQRLEAQRLATMYLNDEERKIIEGLNEKSNERRKPHTT